MQQGEARRPLVFVLHGGATIGNRVSFVGQFLETLTDAGFNWVSLDHRQAVADAADDLGEAMAFVRCHAAALRTDPDKLVLLGEDSGRAARGVGAR